MHKKILAILCCVCLCMPSFWMAQAEGALTGVLADHNELTPSMEWFVEFRTALDGEITLTLLGGEGEEDTVVAAKQVAAGADRIDWDGTMPDGSYAPEGSARLMLTLTASGESTLHMVTVDILPPYTEELDETDETNADGGWNEVEEATAVSDGQKPVPQAGSYWEMDPDAYDLTDPAHQQAIWDIMMQDIIVLDKGQREHVYPTYEPGAELRPRTNIAGELHGASQGVNVIEDDADGDGYVKIQAYSNDGTSIESSHVIAQAAQLIEGYVKKSLLKTITPSRKYGLLIDKLTQTLYIFEDGAIIGELKVSTGFNTASQPYNETPSGEYLTVSWVGQFISGNMYCDLAIRINGGTLLHEVPYKLGTDGKTRYYENFERYLGQKASHGCIRIQRAENPQGQNMQWLWNNLENNTKVLIWEDRGREMPPPEMPDDDTPLYYNPNGGKNYHLDAYCPGVKDRFLPLTGGFTYGDLDEAEYKNLTPCASCGAPDRKETILENYQKAAEQAGATIPEDVLGLWDGATETDQQAQ